MIVYLFGSLVEVNEFPFVNVELASVGDTRIEEGV